MATPGKYDRLIEIWKSLPDNYPETSLEKNFVTPMLDCLGVKLQERCENQLLGTGAGLKPDYLVWSSGIDARDLISNPPDVPPVLVIEDKRRVAHLATASDASFVQQCENSGDYLSAIQGGDGDNGLKQYLNVDNPNIDRKLLASYGLVFNGDFFQLWRRVDGLIFPLTPIQRMTPETIPALMEQLEYILKNPQPALVTAIWNRKGGVGKTTNTLNVGATLASKGKRVLFLNLDTQTDLTRAFNLDLNNIEPWLEKSAYSLLNNQYEVAKKIIGETIKTKKYRTTNKDVFELSILPSRQPELEKFRHKMPGKGKEEIDMTDKDKIKVIGKLLKLLKPYFDYIFIDASPSKDALMSSMLFNIDTILIPADYSRKTLYHAADLYEEDIPYIRSKNLSSGNQNYRPWNLGLVFSNCPNDSGKVLEQCIQDELLARKFNGKQCTTRLKIYAQTKIAEFKHKPVICWSTSPITKLYEELTNEVFLKHNFINQ